MAKQIVLAGFHAVNARGRLQPSSIKVVYVDRDRRDKRMQECRVRLEKAQVKVVFADAARLNGLAPDLPHQGIVALADEIKNSLTFDELLDNITDKTLLLILDGVTDPRNFGACLRVADAAGVQAVIAPKDRSASFSPAAAKAAAEKAIKSCFTGAMLGKSLYRAAIGGAIFSTGMVENYVLQQPEQDITATERTLVRLKSLQVTEDEA